MMFSLLLVMAIAAQAPGVRITAGADAGQVTVVATLPSAEVASAELSLGLVDDATGKAGPCVFGRVNRTADEVQFTPRHRLVPGNTYRAELRLANGASAATDYRVPRREQSAPVVERVYPTSDQLPANLLKFYLHFSQPMREGEQIFDQIHLLDDAGKPIEGPWRLTELWSDNAQRLTLYVHPGRIKTGVNLREQEGPVLLPGRKYTLVVTRDVRDNTGQGLADAFMKTFTTGPEVHAPIDLTAARLSPPAVGSREAVTLSFAQPLDRYLLARCVRVFDRDHQAVPGKVEITAAERRWEFVPDSPWRADEYRLRFDPVLEDLAGNSPDRIFDTDLGQSAPRQQSLTRVFQPR